MTSVLDRNAPPSLASLRNIGIIAHIDAGKTTLTERILYYTSRIHRMGEVHEGAAAMDFLPEEQQRGITIASACCTCSWSGCSINIIDTPGHVDFSIEVERCLRVLDGAVGVFCAVGGVEPQSEAVWRQAEHFAVPKIAFINKMDRPGASFQRVAHEIRERLGARPVPFTLPLGEEEGFEAVLDVLSMERLDFDSAGQGRTYTRRPLNLEESALVAPWREKLLEAAADEDDILLEEYLAGSIPSPHRLKAALRRGVLGRRIVPLYAGAALRNMGVQPLLDGVADFMPSPLDAPPARVEAVPNAPLPVADALSADASAPLAALVFKVFLEGGRKLALLRLYAGSISPGMNCLNVTRGETERISRIFRLEAEAREPLDAAWAGDIVAVQGLRSAVTGDSISAPERPVLLENISSYPAVISLALEPANSPEGCKLDEALARYTLEDPTLKAELDDDTGQRLISGMGELHLEVLCDRLRREYGLNPRRGNQRVLCRESVIKSAEAEGVFERELGGVPHYGWARLRVSPRARGQGNETRVLFAGENWPAPWLDAALQGMEDGLHAGVLRGFPVQDVLVELLALQKRDGASSPAGYNMAASAALKQALESAGPLLLEPLMLLEIAVPSAFLGAALNLVQTQGGKIENMREKGERKLIQALAPLRELFGFSTRLRSATQGRAGLLMRFERFDYIQ